MNKGLSDPKIGGPLLRMEWIKPYMYEFRGNDRSNFLHVFFKDPLWSTLPLDCQLIVLRWVKCHQTQSWWDFISPTKLYHSPTAIMNGEVPGYAVFRAGNWVMPEAYLEHNEEGLN